MNAVVEGFVAASGRTSGRVRYAYANNAKTIAPMPAIVRPTARIISRPFSAHPCYRLFLDSPRTVKRRSLVADRAAAFRERPFECTKEQHDQPRRRARTHQADAPHFARQRTEARANFNIEFVEQMFAHRRV